MNKTKIIETATEQFRRSIADYNKHSVGDVAELKEIVILGRGKGKFISAPVIVRTKYGICPGIIIGHSELKDFELNNIGHQVDYIYTEDNKAVPNVVGFTLHFINQTRLEASASSKGGAL